MNRILSLLIVFVLAISATAQASPPDLDNPEGSKQKGLRLSSPSLGGIKFGVNRQLTDHILDFQEGLTGDVPFLLRNYQAASLEPNTVYFGGYLRGGLYAEYTNTDGKFPLLSRFPHQHDDDDSNTDAVLQNAAISVVGNFGRWVTALLQIEHSEVFFRQDHDSVQLREGYVIVGNLEKAPVYVAIGRKTIDFGEFDTFTPFTHSVNQHYFWAQSDEPVIEFGYMKDNFRASTTLISGKRQLRTAFAGHNGYPGNFAVKVENAFAIEKIRANAHVSVSYLHDTIYRSNFTAHTADALGRQAPPNAPVFPNVYVEDRVGLINLAGMLSTSNADFGIEYTRATDKWPATSLSGVTGEVYDDVPVLQAITLQGRYRFNMLNRDAAVSAVLSRGIFGPDDSEFDMADQHSLAAEWDILPFATVAAEYVYNNGFQPFVGIQDVSDTNVESHTFILGGEAKF